MHLYTLRGWVTRRNPFRFDRLKFSGRLSKERSRQWKESPIRVKNNISCSIRHFDVGLSMKIILVAEFYRLIVLDTIWSSCIVK